MDGDNEVFTIGNNGNTEISNDVTIGGDLIIGTTSIEVESKFGTLDDSINYLETTISAVDASVNVLETITTDISYASGTTTILNNLDVSGDLSIDGSLNLGTIQDMESKLGELDNSVNYLETTISAFDASVNALETITTDISCISGTTTVTGALDISSTDSLLIPRGTTSERNSETQGLCDLIATLVYVKFIRSQTFGAAFQYTKQNNRQR